MIYPMKVFKPLNFKYVCDLDDSGVIKAEEMIYKFCIKEGLIVAGSHNGRYVVEDKNGSRFLVICKGKDSFRSLVLKPTKLKRLKSTDLVPKTIELADIGSKFDSLTAEVSENPEDFALELLLYCS